jgi:hypothetical protein
LERRRYSQMAIVVSIHTEQLFDMRIDKQVGAVRTAIGQGLRAHYPSPLELPADLFALASRLSDQQKQTR